MRIKKPITNFSEVWDLQLVLKKWIRTQGGYPFLFDGEEQALVLLALRPSSLRRGKSHQVFAAMFARDPDAMLAAMVYLRGVLDRWGKTGSGAVRKYLRTHPEAASMQDGEISMAIDNEHGPVTTETVKNTRQELANFDEVLRWWHDPRRVHFLKTGQHPKKEKSKTVRKGKKQAK